MAEYSPSEHTPRVDIHCHIIPGEFWKASESADGWFGAKISTKNGNSFIDTADRFAGPIEPNWRLSIDERISLMESIGVDRQVLSTPPYFFNYHLDLRDGKESARSINEELVSIISARPDKFDALATIPFQDVDSAISELEWAMSNGMKGAEICTHVNGMNFDDRVLWPLFEAAEHLGAFLFFHPHAPAGVDRMKDYYLANILGNPLENTIAIASIIFGGLLDRYSDLKLCFAHGGGYACFGAPRMNRGHLVRPESRLNTSKGPSDYLKSLYYDCLTHGYDELEFLVNKVGADRILMGSDFPFDMGLDSPAEWVDGATNLSPSEKDMILGANAVRLLGL